MKNSINPTQKPHRHKRTFGQRASDVLTTWMGSWFFISLFALFLIIWMVINGHYLIQYTLYGAFDPYPFILLNLVLSCLAAIQAPIILMSQNRQTERDRRRFEYDYAVNRKAEHEIADMQRDLEVIKDLIRTVKQDYKLNVKTDKSVDHMKRHITDIKKTHMEATKHLEGLKKDLRAIRKEVFPQG